MIDWLTHHSFTKAVAININGSAMGPRNRGMDSRCLLAVMLWFWHKDWVKRNYSPLLFGCLMDWQDCAQ
eukprot:2414628-Amphidinium_carterae.1